MLKEWLLRNRARSSISDESRSLPPSEGTEVMIKKNRDIVINDWIVKVHEIVETVAS